VRRVGRLTARTATPAAAALDALAASVAESA
jgi:hypothetical protein